MKKHLALLFVLSAPIGLFAYGPLGGNSNTGARVGEKVNGGTATRVLYLDSNGNMADDTDFTFNGTTVTVDEISADTTTLNGQRYLWPLAGQTASDVLTTDGAGNLTWDAVSAGLTASATSTITAPWTFTSSMTINNSQTNATAVLVIKGSDTAQSNNGLSFEPNGHKGVGSVGIGSQAGAADSASGDMLTALYANSDGTARTKRIGVRNAQSAGTACFAAGNSTSSGQLLSCVNGAGHATPVAYIQTASAYPLRIMPNGAAVTAPLVEFSSYSTINHYGGYRPYQRTSAQLETITPKSAFEYYACTDCSTTGLYRSTGTGLGAFVWEGDGTTAN